MKHFLTTDDWSRDDLQAILDLASRMKADPAGLETGASNALAGKSMALLFFNPSLRTRTSFDLAVHQLGGKAIMLNAGQDSWPIAFEDGAEMLGDEEEHVKEAAQVLSRYVDIIGIRAFPKFQDWSLDRQDRVIRGFAEYGSVPIVNMETITHPCQELALMQTLQERGGDMQGKKFVLTWTYHPKPLNTAVANSAAMIATKFGMDVTLLCPSQDYLLDERYMKAAERNAAAQGGSFTVSHDIEAAYAGADVVYAKSWGAIPYFGNWDAEKPIRDQYRHFIVDEQKMALTNDGLFSHCLPLRRNVKATDAVMDAPYCVAIDEAENRLHVQKALLATLAGESDRGSQP